MISSSRIICPGCAGTNVETSKTRATIPDKFCKPVSFIKITNHCKDCGCDGDFLGLNDVPIRNAIRQCNQDAVVSILKMLNTWGHSDAYLQRVLSLPPGTVELWRKGSFGSSVPVLLKFLATVPVLLNLADENFEMSISGMMALCQKTIDDAKADAAHWKANHDNVCAILSSLRERPDLPEELLARSSRVTAVLRERDQLREQVENLKAQIAMVQVSQEGLIA